MRPTHRSGCPINLALEVLGDRWSLIVIRDMIFGNSRTFGELLENSEEGIASNILSARLKRLESAGLILRRPHPIDQRQTLYRLTNAAIELVPVLAVLGAWGRRHTKASHEMSVRAELLEKGGPSLWDAFMKELRRTHSASPKFAGSRKLAPQTVGPVAQQLQAAYEKAITRERAPPGAASR
jgi:DNA-binding HxlR family transcriptional regulator